jgi:hypothetical protein
MEPDYTKRELDGKFEGVHEKLDKLIVQATYTNGKLRRVIVALLAIGFFTLGLGFKELTPLVSLFLAL